MEFDDLLARVRLRLSGYRYGARDSVLGDTAAAEGARLWQAAQPRDISAMTGPEAERLGMACHVLGWLHYWRLGERRPGDGGAHDLARAIVFLGRLATSPEAVPEDMAGIIGAHADPVAQGRLAYDLMAAAQGSTDPMLSAAAIFLLTEALAVLPADDAHRPDLLCDLHAAFLLMSRFGDPASRERAIEAGEQALLLLPDDAPQREPVAYNLCLEFYRRYERTDSVEDIRRAIEFGEHARWASVKGHVPPGAVDGLLGDLHLHLSSRTADRADLDRGIELNELSLATKRAHGDDVTGALASLCQGYFRRYEGAGSATDLDRAVDLGDPAIAALPADSPGRAVLLACVGLARLRRFERDGTLSDLERAISLCARGVEETPPGDPRRVERLYWLLVCHLWRADGGHTTEDYDRAIELGDVALAEAAETDPYRAVLLADLGQAHSRRLARAGDIADADRAIDLFGQALALMPENHPKRVEVLGDRGSCYRTRFGETGSLSDVDKAIEHGEEALAIVPHDHPKRWAVLYALGQSYRRRYLRTGVPADAARAIDLFERGLAAMDVGDPARRTALMITADLREQRYRRDGSPTDLERAIAHREDVVTDRPDPSALAHLGFAYLTRFDGTEVPADLHRAVDLLTHAVLGEPDDQDRRDAMGKLAGAHRARFEHWGHAADLDRAIDLGERAQEAPGVLSELGLSYFRRFERDGVLADLQLAIDLGERSAADWPPDQAGLAGVLSNLGIAYRLRYERTGVPEDIDRAIELGARSVAAGWSVNPVMHGRHQANLAIAHVIRFQHTYAGEDLDRAIDLGEDARSTLAGRAGSWRNLANLASAYLRRFEHADAGSDIDRAVELFEHAVASSPHGYPERCLYLGQLAFAYLLRLERAGRAVDAASLRDLAAQAASATNASPAQRVYTTGSVGVLALALGDPATAATLFDAAMAMMPLVAPREGEWEDQEYQVDKYRNEVVGDVVAAHCALGDPVAAVAAAELGRGVLLASAMSTRTDLTDLSDAHPVLARRFREVRDGLNTSADVRRRKQRWSEHDRVLAEIREQPGFEGFLLPPRVSELRSAITGGTAVLVNVSRAGGDAILVGPDITHVPLPDLTLADAASRARELLVATHSAGSLAGTLRAKRVLADVLEWLWESAVGPILDALPAHGEPHRVWWMPIGLLGVFPLHAAGDAPDLVVSSYTPTLRALAHNLSRPPTTGRRQLTVALAHTPGLPDLPGTVSEAATLHAQHPDTPPLVGADATTSSVLAAIQDSTWAHFACHATSDLTRSGLSLHDGVLTVPDIARLHLRSAELAYLSACSTAHPGTRNADEALHLASAFHLAGFRHVIASLWPLNDGVAAAAAAAFYRGLPTADHAATTLHRVTRELRDAHPDRPDLWAALVHSGP